MFFFLELMLSPDNGRLFIVSPSMFAVRSPNAPLSALRCSGLLSGINTSSSASILEVSVMSRRPAATAPTAGRRGFCKILEI